MHNARRLEFRAMGTRVTVVAARSRRRETFALTAHRTREIFERLEQTFSRFRPDSELSLVNSRAGRWTSVSPTFAGVLRSALDAAAATKGLFDPTVLPALVAAGYDRDFEQVVSRVSAPQGWAGPSGIWREVEIVRDRVRLPVNAALDFGGFVKGWAVDRAVEEAAPARGWILVDAGGDMRIVGHPETGLEVAVADPHAPGTEAARVSLVSGAIATSSTTRRTWGPRRHHIIDPRTGVPAVSDVVQATVWAVSCCEAEVAAKWVLLGGTDVMRSVPAIVVLRDGSVIDGIGDGLAEGDVA